MDSSDQQPRKLEEFVKPSGEFVKKSLLEKTPIIIFITNVCVFSGFTLIKYAIRHADQYIYMVLPGFKAEEWDQQNKFRLIFTIFFFYGLYMLVCTLLVALSRLFCFKVNPLVNRDTLFICTMNRTIQNSIEQGLIFFPIYSYFLLYFVQADQKAFAILMGLIFLLGRVFFALGYLGIYLRLPTLRGFGFSLTIAPSIILGLRIFGFDIVKEFFDKLPI